MDKIGIVAYRGVIEKAKELAEEYHKGQVRHKTEGGKEIPYSTHLIGVAEMVTQMTDDEELICAAYLHDSIEDIDKPEPGIFNLKKLKSEINSLSPNILKYVEALSHNNDEEDYQEYVKRISKDEKLRIIKICDMIYNVTESPNDKQRKKYRKGLMILFGGLVE